MIPVFKDTTLTPNPQEYLRDQTRVLNMHEGHLDSKGLPIIVDGFRYDNSVMKIVQFVVDNGGAKWKDRSKEANALAKSLGYEATSNCMTDVRTAVTHGLINASIVDGVGFLMATDYGMEQLDMWESQND